MSEAESKPEQGTPYAGGADAPPGTPEPAKLRRRPFGYKRADVDQALETRDSQLSELRQDIAALWLAFAQHDRMIRELGGGPPKPSPASEAPEPAATSSAPAVQPDTAGPEAAEAVGRQLSDLDEVLAAIEMATQTLERTYSDEVAESGEPSGTEPGSSSGASEQDGRTASP